MKRLISGYANRIKNLVTNGGLCAAIAVLIHLTVGIGWAKADVINVINPSFEDVTGSVPFNEFHFGPLPGWQIYDPNGIVVNNGVGPQLWVGTLSPNPPTFFVDGATDGQRVAIAFNVAGTGNLGEYGLQQNLAAMLEPSLRYQLQVDIGNIRSGTAVNGDFFNLDGFPGYRVDLLAGGNVIASDNNTLAGLIDEGRWGTSTIEFDAVAAHPLIGQPLGIRLVNLNIIDAGFPNADLEVDFDNVRLSTTAVPEPSSFALLALPCWQLMFRRSVTLARNRHQAGRKS